MMSYSCNCGAHPSFLDTGIDNERKLLKRRLALPGMAALDNNPECLRQARACS